LTNNIENLLYFNIWWKNLAGISSPNDSLIIWVNDGINKIPVFHALPQDNFSWIDTSVVLPATIDLGSFQLEVQVSDWDFLGDNIVEAGFDNLSINRYPIGLKVNSSQTIKAYPNPSQDGTVFIEHSEQIINCKLYDLSGRLVNELSGKQIDEIKLPYKGCFVLEINGKKFKKTIKLIH